MDSFVELAEADRMVYKIRVHLVLERAEDPYTGSDII
jgi:hypothetical protein